MQALQLFSSSLTFCVFMSTGVLRAVVLRNSNASCCCEAERCRQRYTRCNSGIKFLNGKFRDELLNRAIFTIPSWSRQTLFIEPGCPPQNGYIESFNGKMRDDVLDREVLTTMEEAKVLIKRWRNEYNQIRPAKRQELPTTGPRGNFNRDSEVSSGSVIGCRSEVKRDHLTC